MNDHHPPFFSIEKSEAQSNMPNVMLLIRVFDVRETWNLQFQILALAFTHLGDFL